MFKQGEQRINYLGSAIFVFLFHLFLCAFAQSLNKRIDADFDYKMAPELHTVPAIIVEVQQINFLNSQIPSVDNIRFKLFKERPELISYNNTVLHSIIYLQRAERLIKPVILQRFYKQYHFIDTDDLPNLS